MKRVAQLKMKKERDINKLDITKLDLSNTLELYNVDFARKAVGNLFENDNPQKNENLQKEINLNELPDNTATRPVLIPRTFTKALIDDDLSEGPVEPKLPKARAVKSKYVFVDEEEEDEFSEFRRRYKERDSRNIGPPKKAVVAATELKEEKEPPKREGRKRIEPKEEAYVAASSLGPLRVAIVGMMVVLLLMMAYLVYRNNELSNQLQAANVRLYDLPGLNYQLGVFSGLVTNYQSEIDRLRSLVYNGYQNESLESSYYPYNEYSEYYASEDAPSDETPTTAAYRTHTVVAGENLSRISTYYFGDSSHANILRIVEANSNLPDADAVISPGMTLTIPN